MFNSLYIEKIGFCPVKWDVHEDHGRNEVLFSLDGAVDISHPDNRRIFFEEFFVWVAKWRDGIIDARNITVVNEAEDLVTEFKDSVPNSIFFTELDAKKIKDGTQDWQMELEVKFNKAEYSDMYQYCKRDP